MGQVGSELILNPSKELQEISNFTIADAKWTGQLLGEQQLPTQQDKSDD